MTYREVRSIPRTRFFPFNIVESLDLNMQKLLILGMCLNIAIGFVMIAPASSKELPQITQEKRDRIQQYFRTAEALKILIGKHTQQLEVLAKGISPQEHKHFSEMYSNMEKKFKELEDALFLAHGMTKEEYKAIQAEIMNNPGILAGYIAAGGVVPQTEDEEKPEPAPSPQERLKTKGITLDSLNEETLDKVFNNPDPTVRLDAIEALGAMKDPAHAPHLIKLLKDESLFVQLASAEALCDMSHFEGVELLLSALSYARTDGVARGLVISSAGHCLTHPDISKQLLALLKTETNGTLRLQMALQFERQADLSLLEDMRKIQETEKDFLVRHLLDKMVRDLERKKRIQELIR